MAKPTVESQRIVNAIRRRTTYRSVFEQPKWPGVHNVRCWRIPAINAAAAALGSGSQSKEERPHNVQGRSPFRYQFALPVPVHPQYRRRDT